jgi:hypothetical protein
MQDPASALVDLLVAGVTAAHLQTGVHVNVVRSQIQTDEELKHDAPSREGLCKEDEQAGGGAAIGHHIQHSTEGR